MALCENYTPGVIWIAETVTHEIATSRQGYVNRMEAWVDEANLYLKEHPGAKS